MTADFPLYPPVPICLNLDLWDVQDYVIFGVHIFRSESRNPFIMAIMVQDFSNCLETEWMHPGKFGKYYTLVIAPPPLFGCFPKTKIPIFYREERARRANEDRRDRVVGLGRGLLPTLSVLVLSCELSEQARTSGASESWTFKTTDQISARPPPVSEVPGMLPKVKRRTVQRVCRSSGSASVVRALPPLRPFYRQKGPKTVGCAHTFGCGDRSLR